MKKIMLNIVVILSITMLLQSCMHQLTKAQSTCLSAAYRAPTTFKVPINEEKATWARAQAFVSRFSSMRVDVVSDNMIQTYTPVGDWPKFGYIITKIPENDNEITIDVNCMYSNMFAGDKANRNAHIASYYIRTGNLCKDLIWR